MASAQQAIDSAGLDFKAEDSESLREKTGTLIGVGIGSLQIIEENALRIKRAGAFLLFLFRRLSPTRLPVR